MMGFFRSAYVIGRRDFTATVFSKTFVIFLLGPLIIIAISFGFGSLSEKMARQDTRSTVAIIAKEADYKVISEARDRIAPAFGENSLPDLIRSEPDYVLDLQVETLLASHDKRVLAVLSGSLAKPRLTGSVSETGSIRRQMTLILEEARQRAALAGAGAALDPVDIELVRVEGAAGSVAAQRAITARASQLLVFTLTLLLGGMLLSNLVEEKSNKIIEVLAAAIPVDAIFVGKLFSMMAVSMVGITVWAAGALVAISVFSGGAPSFPEPGVGWPAFVLLTLIYYCMNYSLLGALFLGIGSQAASMREVQTLSMPITVGQMLILMLASFAVGPYDQPIGIAAAIFPFSSPLTMVGRAAQAAELWPHLLAILWQLLWVWLTIKLAAGLFRHNVMKSGSGGRQRRFRRSRA